MYIPLPVLFLLIVALLVILSRRSEYSAYEDADNIHEDDLSHEEPPVTFRSRQDEEDYWMGYAAAWSLATDERREELERRPMPLPYREY